MGMGGVAPWLAALAPSAAWLPVVRWLGPGLEGGPARDLQRRRRHARSTPWRGMASWRRFRALVSRLGPRAVVPPRTCRLDASRLCSVVDVARFGELGMAP